MKYLFNYIIFLLFINVSSAQSIIDTSISTSQFSILFDSDKHTIRDSFKVQLDSLITKWHSGKETHLVLKAHTDSIGSDEYNINLSKRRLNAVTAYLEKGGVSDTLIVSNFYGEKLPTVDNKNASLRQLNRRVEVFVSQKTKAKLLVGRVVDAKSNQGLKSHLDISFGNEDQRLLTESDGKFELLIPLTNGIEIVANAENYFFRHLKIKPQVLANLDSIIIKMSKMDIGSKYSLKGLNFVSNKCIILPKSIPILHRLISTMTTNEDLCIEIGGHINLPNRPKVTNQSDYYDLSLSRATVVYDSLVNAGIESVRMYTKAYGNWEMINPKAKSEIKQAENRRVEIEVVDCADSATIHNEQVRWPAIHGYKVR
ncbi:MAG: OmpA family protein [Saprospiraceae bacterium]|nr:OmpA family protein [Saprospiraceae bacterium]